MKSGVAAAICSNSRDCRSNRVTMSRSESSACFRAVTSVAAPNHSMIRPSSARIGTARELVHPTDPSISG